MLLPKGPLTTGIISELIAKGVETKEFRAHSLFPDQVRNGLSGGGRVRAIEYSAREEMIVRRSFRLPYRDHILSPA